MQPSFETGDIVRFTKTCTLHDVFGGYVVIEAGTPARVWTTPHPADDYTHETPKELFSHNEYGIVCTVEVKNGIFTEKQRQQEPVTPYDGETFDAPIEFLRLVHSN